MNEPLLVSSVLIFSSLVCMKVVQDALNQLADRIVAQRQSKVIVGQKHT